MEVPAAGSADMAARCNVTVVCCCRIKRYSEDCGDKGTPAEVADDEDVEAVAAVD